MTTPTESLPEYGNCHNMVGNESSPQPGLMRAMLDDPALAAVLSFSTLANLWLGAFVGALAAGGAGFAFGVVASSIWLHKLEPVYATFLVVACGTILHVGLIWPARKGIAASRLWPFIAGGLIGIPLGVYILTHGNAAILKTGIGAFLAIYGIYALVTPRLPVIRKGGRMADVGIGFAGGIMGGIGGYSGVLPAIWAQLKGWPKDIARGVYQPFILFGHVTTLLLVGFVALNRMGVLLLIAALPALLAGAWCGWHIYGRLDETRFRQVVAAILVGSGAALVV